MQVPLLEIDGLKLVQRDAIIRYIARKYGLYGNTLDEQTKVDVLYEGAKDFLFSFMSFGFYGDDEKVMENIKSKTLPRYLPIFERLLSESSSGYLVGDGLTYADLCLLEALLVTEEYFPELLSDYDKLKDFKVKISSLPRIKAFLEGPQRKRKNTPEYCGTVKEVYYKCSSTSFQLQELVTKRYFRNLSGLVVLPCTCTTTD
ncbi:glutathione S-transferase 3-like [Saccoglossus kowalevskii]